MRFLIDELMLECKRRGIKITQKDLADAAGVGQTAIHKIIRGDTQAPKPQILLAIADTFTETLGRQVTIDDLIEKQGDTSSPPSAADIEGRAIEQADYARLPLYSPDTPCGDLAHVAEEHIIEYLSLPKWLTGPAEFALRARGDSMEPTIQDGDLLLVEPGNHWNDKDIVIAWVDGAVTCKRLQINHKHVLLVPDNREHKVIPINGDTVILGRVVGRYEAFINGWKS